MDQTIEALNECDNPSSDNVFETILSIKILTVEIDLNNLVHEATTHSGPKKVGKNDSKYVTKYVSQDNNVNDNKYVNVEVCQEASEYVSNNVNKNEEASQEVSNDVNDDEEASKYVNKDINDNENE